MRVTASECHVSTIWRCFKRSFSGYSNKKCMPSPTKQRWNVKIPLSKKDNPLPTSFLHFCWGGARGLVSGFTAVFFDFFVS